MNLKTLAEESDFRQTGRLDDVEALSAGFARAWPDAVRSFEFGRSAQGRPMRALIVSRKGYLTPEAIRAAGVPLLLIQGGIHPGESDGKDGGFIALRELLKGKEGDDTLRRIALLFVPAFNTDGHERFGRWNRPNQNGPEECGWRTTAQNLNLNRDYTKADSVEMQAMLRLIATWDPLICADLHVTDGADFEPDVSIQVEPVNQGDAALRPLGVQMREGLIEHLTAQGSMPLPFYPDLARADDPSSGFVLTVYSPRFSTGYFPQRNRFTVLVETHGWKPYAHRVRVMRNSVTALAALTASQGKAWLEAARRADEASCALGGSELALKFNSPWREVVSAGAASPDTVSDDEGRLIDFQGYAYTRTPSAVSGDLVTVYDPTTPEVWRVPLRDTVTAALTVTVPRGGYLVPVEYAAEIGVKLKLHGIAFEPLATLRKDLPIEVFRAESVSFSGVPYEGRLCAALEGRWETRSQTLDAGSLYVPIAQRLSRLIVALFEPQAPDSFAAWGFFNACFEIKEQVEPYVAEIIAREMLASDPELNEAFDEALERDAAFAKNPAARFEWFLRRHASWDTRYNQYPALRLDSPDLL